MGKSSQLIDCLSSDVRADILMLTIEQEENKPIKKCLSCGSIDDVSNGMCKKCYDAYLTIMCQAMVNYWKDDLMDADNKNTYTTPRGERSSCIVIDDCRELDEETQRIIEEYLNQNKKNKETIESCLM